MFCICRFVLLIFVILLFCEENILLNFRILFAQILLFYFYKFTLYEFLLFYKMIKMFFKLGLFQATLYNEINAVQKRNQCAMQFRLLDEEYPGKNQSPLLTLL